MKLEDTLFAVDVGYDLEKIADKYIEAFNKSGAYMVSQHKIREPIESELEAARSQLGESYVIKKENNYWVVKSRMLDSDVVKKRIFVLVFLKIQKTPEHIMKLRTKAITNDKNDNL